jgi:hypothetical protein
MLLEGGPLVGTPLEYGAVVLGSSPAGCVRRHRLAVGRCHTAWQGSGDIPWRLQQCLDPIFVLYNLLGISYVERGAASLLTALSKLITYSSLWKILRAYQGRLT